MNNRQTSKNKQLLIMMVGTLGSGKSYFARQLADKIGAKRFNADMIRKELFKTYEKWSQPENKKEMLKVLNNRAETALKEGYHVIRDYQHNHRNSRAKIRETAEKANALPIVVWVKTPAEIAISRAIIRPEAIDTIKFSESFIRNAIKRHLANLETFADNELVIDIDGQATFEDQYKVFASRLSDTLTS